MIARLRRTLSAAVGLRTRVSIGMLSVAFAACIGFALAIYAFVSILQDELQFDTIDRELASLVLDYKHGVPISGRRGSTGWVYVSHSPAHDQSLPAVLQRIANNQYDVVRYHGRQYYAARRDVDNAAIYMMVNVQDVKEFEDRLATLGWATLSVVIVLALLIGIGFSYLILRPVRRLAERLSSYRPGQSNPPIAADYGDRDMRDIAESFDELIGRFDAAIAREKAFTEDASHELRTPLAVALNASELLDGMPDLDERARNRVARVRHACERMQRLVTALLYLARDQQRENETLSDAAVVLDDVLVYQRDAMEANGVELSVEARSTPLPLPDGVIYSVLHNLIDNAVRHTENGRLWVEVTPERICVTDTGSGLPAEALTHIFERQYRTADSPGLGIGLYLVSRICDRQGWSIHADSEPGVGTRIEIVLDSATASRAETEALPRA
ncbi:sensor histidine kinase [Salinisphaera hydrothermalis]|uniref:histidine kinase n=1 Tax=Salinisphaera hydrothermalis (strain C41B8) TaxID=1304275 RepID=A0A084IMS1_SALHC|nr:HAMP domain-containing sensor histidine kinase [Salinisphaera hydrothermalis]KEZ78005.1 periplasmic sensor signal transduction histidine kinase [Salinisphaera hydrothermalis C41B8]